MPSELDELLAEFWSADPYVRARAVKHLRGLGDDAPVAHYLKAIPTADEDFQQLLAEALSDYESFEDEQLPAIVGLLSIPSRPIEDFVAYALTQAEVNRKKVEALLIEALKKDDPRVKAKAAFVLGELDSRSKAFNAALEVAARDGESLVANAARAALALLTPSRKKFEPWPKLLHFGPNPGVSSTHIAFLDAPLDEAVAAYTRWMKWIGGFRFKWVSCEGSLVTCLGRLDAHRSKFDPVLFIETDSFWTAAFGGMGDGLPSDVCKREGIRGVRVAYGQPKRQVEGYGCVNFEHCHADDQRHIHLSEQTSAWYFYQRGEILSFEEPEQYESRRIVDRFTPEMLQRYCAALGIRLFDESFYGGRGSIFVKDPKYWHKGDGLT